MTTEAPDTIVLVHGFWVTPRSWEEWIAHYESKGFTVIAPAYPGFEVVSSVAQWPGRLSAEVPSNVGLEPRRLGTAPAVAPALPVGPG